MTQLLVRHAKLYVFRDLLLQFFLVLVVLTRSWSVNFGPVARRLYTTNNPSPPEWGVYEAKDKNRCVLDSGTHREPEPHNSAHSYYE